MTNELQSLLRGMIDKWQKAIARGEAVRGDDFLGILMEWHSRARGREGMSMEEVMEECKMLHLKSARVDHGALMPTPRVANKGQGGG